MKNQSPRIWIITLIVLFIFSLGHKSSAAVSENIGSVLFNSEWYPDCCQSDKPVISGDDRYIAYWHKYSFFNDYVYLYDMLTGSTKLVEGSSEYGDPVNNFYSINPGFSADGQFITFASGATNLVEGDTNNRRDVFVHDLQTGQTTRVSVSSDGVDGNQVAYSKTEILF
jgi:Tol biopolymer transport system component